VTLSFESRSVPVGQLSTHFPSNKTDPGIQDVHRAWSIVDEVLKVGILQDAHFELQAWYEGLDVTIHVEMEKRYSLSQRRLSLSATSTTDRFTLPLLI